MMEVLVGSAPPRLLRPTRFVVSFLTHALTIGLMVAASGAVADDPRLAMDTTLVFLLRPEEPEPPPPEPPPPPVEPVAAVVVAEPPPKGFQTVVAPEDIPTEIPPIDLDDPPFDPRDYTGRGVEGGVADGVVGGTGKVERDKGGRGDIVYTAATDDSRFRPAVLVSQPQPKYPPILQEIGLSGRVALRFLVDTTGRVEPGSIEVIETTHERFAEPARASVAQAIFRPARMGGRPVRQLAEQAIRFVVPE